MQTVIIIGSPEKTKEQAQDLIKQNLISGFDAENYSFEKAIGIADIGNIQKTIFLKPVYSQKKAVIVEAFSGITTEAQNSFLKILEEPPESAIIMMLVKNVDFLLPTVISRCAIINLSDRKTIDKNEEEKYLRLINSVLNGTANPMVLAQDYSKDKETALILLEKLILAVEKNLKDDLNFAGTLRKLQETHAAIKNTNANTRFALEHLFLNL